MNDLYFIALRDLVNNEKVTILLTADSREAARAQALENLIREPDQYEVLAVTHICQTPDNVDTEI
jgi:hypothetical protein